VSLMVPFADLANHSPVANAEFRYETTAGAFQISAARVSRHPLPPWLVVPVCALFTRPALTWLLGVWISVSLSVWLLAAQGVEFLPVCPSVRHAPGSACRTCRRARRCCCTTPARATTTCSATMASLSRATPSTGSHSTPVRRSQIHAWQTDRFMRGRWTDPRMAGPWRSIRPLTGRSKMGDRQTDRQTPRQWCARSNVTRCSALHQT
jgi:hypothetical protein